MSARYPPRSEPARPELAGPARFTPKAVTLSRLRFLKSLHVSRHCNAVYVNNPKVACSTIKLALQRAEAGDPAYRPARSVHDHAGSPLLTWPELRWRDLDPQLERATLFSFVRCPYRRLASAYANKIVAPQKQGRPREQAGFAADDCPSFEAFVRAIAAQDPTRHNPHWRAQWINLSAGALRYDFIGRLERFEADWAALAARLGLPATPPERAGKRSDRRRASYTPALAALVARLYARDFEIFGYDPDDVPRD